MIKEIKDCVAFDDVLLEPVYSEGRSRLSVDTTTYVGPIKLNIPLISSPMDTVTESNMAISLGRLGGMGIIHRFCTINEQLDMIYDLIRASDESSTKIPIVPAVGVTNDEKERLEYIYDSFGNQIDMFSIDIANGHSSLMRDMVKFVKTIDSNIPIMIGNIATADGYRFAIDLGVDAVRVGIGGGAICKTRIQTGFGIPTLQSVVDCYEAKVQYKGAEKLPSIIADGGIKYPGDLVKSLVAGADAIICGSIFAGTDEAPGVIIIDNNGEKWKNYRGMASEAVQVEKRGGLKPGTCAEGVSQLIQYKGPVSGVVNEFIGGLRSGMTYGNALTIEELRKINMLKVTDSGLNESHAYGTRRR